MAEAIVYKLRTIPLPEGYYDFIPSENPLIEMMGLKFYGSQLTFYIAVVNADSPGQMGDWDVTPIEVDGYVSEFSSIRDGFDYDANKFSIADFDMKVLNLDKFWSDNVFYDGNHNIELRITMYDSYLEAEVPIFWGMIPKESMEFDILAADRDVNDKSYFTEKYITYREYSFKVLNFINGLKGVPILNLKNELIRMYDDDGLFNAYVLSDVVNYPVPGKQGAENLYYANAVFIPLQTIFNVIVNLISPNFQIFDIYSIKSDFEFDGHYLDASKYTEYVKVGLIGWIDAHYITLTGTQIITRIFSKSFLDQDENTSHSFFKYQNCKDLLVELSSEFGLVWRIDYSIADQNKPYVFNYTHRFVSRKNGYKTITLDNALISEPKVSIQVESVKGCKVSTPNGNDVFIGSETNDSLNKTCLFYTYIQALHGIYKIGDVENITPIIPVTIEGVEYSNMANAIANYYCGTNGFYSKRRECLNITYASLKATFNGVTAYEYLVPLNKFLLKYKKGGIGYQDTFTIIQVEKSIDKDESKLELRKY